MSPRISNTRCYTGQTASRVLSQLARWLLALAVSCIAMPAFADPPSRVARFSVLSGEVAFAPAGDADWQPADLNRPLVAGDRVYTEDAARTELDLGPAAVRLDARSELELQQLDDQTARLVLYAGTLNLTVRNLDDGQQYEIVTPTLALVVREPGAYRIDVRDTATYLAAFDGQAEVYGANDARQRVRAGQVYRFTDNTLRDVDVSELPAEDDFDAWCFARDQRYRNPVARRYVSEDVIGHAELDDYGDWHEETDYGPVWYPRHVSSEWAPYRDGHWAWVEPWGWTWVDAAPWGFAPSHYGRWVCVRERWGWIPGPAQVRPVYAPALVAFIGVNHWDVGSAHGARPVGWYPLGPRDIYEPPYHVSRNYFHNVNVTNIHQHTVINNTVINNVYNDYAGGRPARGKRHTHRDNPRAVTAVERDTFVNARPVGRAHKRLRPEDLHQVTVATRPDAEPTQASRAPRATLSRPERPQRSLKQDVTKRPYPLPDTKRHMSYPSESRKAQALRAETRPRVPAPERKAVHARSTITTPLHPAHTPASIRTPRKDVVDTRKPTKETRRIQSQPKSASVHQESRRTAAPLEGQRGTPHARTAERPRKQAASAPSHHAAPAVVAKNEAQNPRTKLRERQRERKEGMREGMARYAGSMPPR